MVGDRGGHSYFGSCSRWITSLEPHHDDASTGCSSFSSQTRNRVGRRFVNNPTETSTTLRTQRNVTRQYQVGASDRTTSRVAARPAMTTRVPQCCPFNGSVARSASSSHRSGWPPRVDRIMVRSTRDAILGHFPAGLRPVADDSRCARVRLDRSLADDHRTRSNSGLVCGASCVLARLPFLLWPFLLFAPGENAFPPGR